MDVNALCSELIDILNRKKEYLELMLDLTNQQSTAIDNQDDDGLDLLIEEKQKYIRLVDNLDEAFIKITDRIKNHLGINSLDEIRSDVPSFKEVKSHVGEIQIIIERIMLKENDNSVKIKKEFDDIKNKLKEISGGKKAISAYGGQNTPTSGGIFFDNKK